MIGTGLALPPGPVRSLAGVPVPGTPVAANITVPGAMTGQSLAAMQAEQKVKSEEAAKTAFEAQQQEEGVAGLAGHVKAFWTVAREAKRDVEEQMLEALYARRGEYTPAKLAQVQAAGQPAIYMMLAASKMRQIGALLRDVLTGSGTGKPWTVEPLPTADLPPLEVAKIKAEVTEELTEAILMGLQPSQAEVRERLETAKNDLLNRMREAADAACARMEDKMETQLDEGKFPIALDQFITDLTTFKTAFIAGPIVRNKPRVTWVPGNPVPVVRMTSTLEWERLDPFDVYPMPGARTINEGPLIVKHRLTRQALNDMRGVEGFSEDAVRSVIAMFGEGGLRSDWSDIDSRKARAEGKFTTTETWDTGLIDALQYWGSVSGRMLLDWGMKPKAVPDPTAEYQVEVWLIGPYVIKAVLNSDPLARRGVYAASYEPVPGTVWGNAPYDLCRDCADMCNASARSLAANMGISSGPQVGVNVSRMPAGAEANKMYPWKVWEFEDDPMGNNSSQAPLWFFQPKSNAAELMAVYKHFSDMADEYTGIPKYTTGVEGTPGAGRTASGLSMMLGNASKIIKQVISGIDTYVISEVIERLYYHNMRWGTDPDLKGAVQVRARGAMSLATKETAQVRRNEFLNATNNPTDMQITGLEGRAEVLRASLDGLDVNPDKVVPPPALVKERQRRVQMAQTAMAAEAQSQGTPGSPGQSGASPAPQGQLMDGAPVTNNFRPSPAPAQA